MKSASAEASSATTTAGLLHIPPKLLPVERSTTHTPLLEKAQETIFYLAYGSNLCSATFLGRRGIRPLSSIPVRVPELTLTFSLPGIAYLEPCFANVSFTENPDPSWWKGGLIGVVYEVTQSDFAKILATEGGGTAYQIRSVTAVTLEGGKTIDAKTLLAPLARERHSGAQPSKRYLDLIRTGARQHSLPEDYREWLEGLQDYKRTTMGQKIGGALWAASWLPFVFGIMFLSRTFADKEGRAPGWVSTVQTTMGKVMWAVYDNVFKHIWGDGERAVEEDRGRERVRL
ncbi:Similar to Gamma-glutamylcyclotransferase; acc. no. Q9D7X8 [Pyronema omphalodes CBS 100304]|uniref:gamma-glutamylcyclotransferase n=1 Tax=Pyronema omphalodes (strain CBS 100304) TaxID=1076935 RepID=U4KWM4_PYROM|nr:Similar to Gamma-glutamylcyclotransferase; acc. no. Q9D7X8 [Pyronema omphalodes CBS 100304]